MTLRIALAGAGMVARHHAIAWRKVPGVEVVAVADPWPSRAASFAREHDIAAAYDDAARMVEKARPDALDIAAAHEAHGPLARLSARAQVPFLCQKPLAPTLEESEAIVADVGDSVRWAIHENWCFRPWYVEIGRRLAGGAIGDLRALTIAARGSGLLLDDNGVRPALVRQPMLATIERLALGEVLVHHVDLANRLAGPSVLEAVTLRRAVDATRGESAARVELVATTGAPIVLEADLAWPGAPARVDDTCEVVGTRDTMRFDGGRLTGGGPTIVFDSEGGYQASYDAAIADFADALARGHAFATPPQAHLRVMRRIDEAYRRAVWDDRRPS